MPDQQQLVLAAFAGVDIPTFIVDREIRFVMFNEAYRRLCDLLQIDLTDAIGRPLVEVVPAVRDFATEEITRAFETGQKSTRIDTLSTQAGVIDLEAHLFPILIGGAITHVGLVLHDVTTFRAMERATRESHETTRALMNSASAVMMLADAEGRILDCNEPGARWFNRSIDEVIGRLGQEIASPEWVAAVTPYFVDALFKKDVVRFQFSKDELKYDASIMPILDVDDQIARFAIYAIDITQQERAIEEIRDSEARFSAMFRSSPDAFAISNAETTVIIDVNESWTRLLGYSREESIGRPSDELGLLEDAAMRREIVSRIRQTGHLRDYPIRIRQKSGRILDAEISAEILPTGGRSLLFSVIRDVTKRKQAEESLRESEERFRIMADSTPAIIWVTDAQGDNVFVNRAYREFVAGTQETVAGERWKLFIHPDDVEQYVAAFAEALEQRTPFYGQTRIKRHDGEWRWIESYAAPRFSPTGEFLGMAGNSPDVTERKLAEEAVHQSEKRFRLQFESIPVPTYIYELRDDDLYMIDYNPAAFEFTHGGVEQLCNLSARQLHARNPQVFEDLYRCATEQVLINREYLYEFQLTPRKTYLDVRYVPFAPNRVLVHTVDLTEHKAVEQELRESRQAYRDLVENVNDVLFSVDRDGVLTYVSPAVKRVLDYEPADVIGKPVWPLIHPDDLAIVQASLVEVLANRLYPSEYRLLSKTGEARWVQTSSRPIVENGVAVGLRGVMVDIAVRKGVEDQLREAHRQLEARVAERTEELARANEQLQIEQDTLKRKNLVLQELMAQIETSRHHAAMQILANIERVVLPIVGHLEEGRLDARSSRYVTLLKQTLSEITAPFAATLDSAYHQLTPVEVEICNLIRLGYGSKQIAEQRHSSVQTVVKQRKVIRRKLGIGHSKTTLVHYLSKLQADSTKTD